LLARVSIGKIMKLPDWTKPALVGAGVGAVVLAIFGFSWGGWMTDGSAQDLADKLSSEAVATALTPYCVLKAQSDPNQAAVMQELGAASAYKKQSIIRDSGWATPLGMDAPNTLLARSCRSVLEEAS